MTMSVPDEYEDADPKAIAQLIETRPFSKILVRRVLVRAQSTLDPDDESTVKTTFVNLRAYPSLNLSSRRRQRALLSMMRMTLLQKPTL